MNIRLHAALEPVARNENQINKIAKVGDERISTSGTSTLLPENPCSDP